MAKTKGILIIAVGHSYYLAMAINLAASIRVNDPGLQIALATDAPPPGWLQEKKLIDINVHVTQDMIRHDNNLAFIKVKLHMLDLSPFDETIFLDCDQILIPNKKISPVFDELQAVDLTISNTGIAGSSIWCNIAEVNTLYKKDEAHKFWNYHSEFFYFKKTKVAKEYFKAAKKVFKDNKIKSATHFGNAPMADELAFQCASLITGTYPHKINWLPNFWYARNTKDSRRYPYELVNYITYSIGGNTVPVAVKTNYNNLATAYFTRLGLQNPYKVIDKKYFVPGRKIN